MCLKLTKVEFKFRSKIILSQFFVLSASASVFGLRPNICWPDIRLRPIVKNMASVIHWYRDALMHLCPNINFEKVSNGQPEIQTKTSLTKNFTVIKMNIFLQESKKVSHLLANTNKNWKIL